MALETEEIASVLKARGGPSAIQRVSRVQSIIKSFYLDKVCVF